MRDKGIHLGNLAASAIVNSLSDKIQECATLRKERDALKRVVSCFINPMLIKIGCSCEQDQTCVVCRLYQAVVAYETEFKDGKE